MFSSRNSVGKLSIGFPISEKFFKLLIPARIAEIAISFRTARRLKLPDAIILASAQFLGATLVTRNTKDFGEGEIGIVVPYNLK